MLKIFGGVNQLEALREWGDDKKDST